MFEFDSEKIVPRKPSEKKVEKNISYLFPMESNTDVRKEYPELYTIDEFKDLNTSELRLCWFIGNSTSPLYNIKDVSERIKKSLEFVYSSDRLSSDGWIKNLYNSKDAKNDLPENIFIGYKKMESFILEKRTRAKLNDEYIFDVIMKLPSNVNPEELKEPDDIKKYSDMLFSISEKIGPLITRMESGYGVKIKGRESSGKNKNVAKVTINDIT